MCRTGDEVKARAGGGDLREGLGRRAFLALAAGALSPPAGPASAAEEVAGQVRLGLAGPPAAFRLSLAQGEATLVWTGAEEGLAPLRWPALGARLLGILPLAGRQVVTFVFTPPRVTARDLSLLLVAGADGRRVGILALELWHWEGMAGEWLASTLDAPGGGVELRLVRYAHAPKAGPGAVTYWSDHLFWQEGAPLLARAPRPPAAASWQGRLDLLRTRLRPRLTPPPLRLTEDLLRDSGLLEPGRIFAENPG